MKTFIFLLCSITIASAQTQSLDANVTTTNSSSQAIIGYQQGTQGANQNVWQKIVQITDTQGNVTYQTNNAYTELATGLNHLINGKWVASKEEIDISADGNSALATNGQHQAYFPGDIYSGQIELVTPDGKQLYSRPVGLSYFDGTNSVLIAELTNSTGQVVGNNQVIYANAFTDFKADIRYTYTKAGFEQDIILREQPPSPASFGLNPDTTTLQVLTEFFNPPQPTVTANTIPTDAGNLEDDFLDFGVMQMIPGKAFLLGATTPSVGVNKQWLMLDGRQILVEEVPVVSIDNELKQLPLPQTTSIQPNPPLNVVSNRRLLPTQRMATIPNKHPMQLAQAPPPSRGLVLDYVTMTSQTNYTFRGDITYYISGAVNLYQTNTFEGGAVLKYTNNASVNLESGTVLNWNAAAYRPVIFTAKDDNSVGDSISGSTGSPTNYYANPALNFNSGAPTYSVSNFRIAWASQAISVGTFTTTSLYHGQLVNCLNGITFSYGTMNVRNLLFANVQTNFNNLDANNFSVQNSTFSGSACMIQGPDYDSPVFTNCILVNVTSLTNGAVSSFSGDHNGFYNSPSFGTNTKTNTFYPFKPIGAGNYYLTNGCAFTNAGTSSIDPTLLSNLQQKTTYPPLFLTNQTLSVNTNFNPQAQRDTNSSPTLGYHYDPIDYIADLYTVTNATLTLTNGVAIASYNEAGVQLQRGSKMVSTGSPLYPNWFVRYSSVQEQSVSLHGTNSGGVDVIPTYTSVMPNAQYQFTKFACPAGGGIHLYDYNTSSLSNLTVQECEFWGGTNVLGGTNSAVLTLNNNLFARSVISAAGSGSLSFTNNLVWGASLAQLNPSGTNKWYAYNNDFDSSTITNSTLTNGYNAYLNYSGYLSPTNTTDIFSTNTLAYQTSWLGTFYQPSTSLLIDMGSTNASALGLYHYTTQTNQVPETNSTVDIGYHYVATDTNGIPLDSNGDGIPDYVEDANGDGIVDNGETNWGLAILTQPVSQTVPQGTNVTFSANVQGVAPLNLQWYLNGTALGGATNSSITISNVQVANEGNYQLVVTNFTGSLTSSVATLTLTCDGPPSGLVGWWQAESNALDSAGTDNGIVTNGVSYTAGKLGTAFNFDGTNGFIQILDAPDLDPTNLTIEAWVRFSSLNSQRYGSYGGGPPAGEQFIVTKPNIQVNPYQSAYVLYKYRNGSVDNFEFEVDSTNGTQVYVTSSVSIQTNVWYHVAAERGSNYIQLFVNGQPTSRATVSFAQNYGNEPLFIGSSGQPSYWDARFEGSLDEISLYNRALSTNEILAIYAAGTNGLGKCLLPPTIITQPSSQTAIVGETVTLMVVATGSQPLSYQWYLNGTNAITGGTNAILLLPNVQSTNTGNYSVTVSNGEGVVTSTSALLDVETCSANLDVAMVMDHSGSMSNQLSDGTVKLAAIRIAATNFAQNLVFSNDQASVFSFNDTVTTNQTLTNSQSAVLHGIGTITNASGQTYMAGALQSAQAELTGTRHHAYALPVMVFLSDGDPNDIANNFVATSNLVLNTATQIKATGTRLITIAVGTDADTNFMRLMATSTNDFYYATNSAQLTNAYNLIATSICRGSSALTVSITSPTNNQMLLARTNFTISATATNTTPGVTVSWVEFFDNGTNSLGFAVTPTSGLYQMNWIPPVGGTNVLTALAMDSRGSNVLSSAVTIYVRGVPAVTITNPTNSQTFSLVSPMTSTNISISATATPDGATITNVTFYSGTNKIGTKTSSPFSITWSNVAAGTYTLTAQATDSTGLSGSSFPVVITIEPTNLAPVVYAGPNQTVYLSTNITQMSGFASDDGLPLGGTLSTTWTNLNGGTNVTFVSSNVPISGVHFWATGTYTNRLSASDGQYTTYSTNIVTVLPSTVAPTVNAGTNQTIILPAQYSVTNNPVYAASSQDIISSEGKEFWLGFPANAFAIQDSYTNTILTLFISSETNTFVSVMAPGIGFYTNCTVIAGVGTVVTIPYTAEALIDEQQEAQGIHIVAQDNISVSGFDYLPYYEPDYFAFDSVDGYCGLPLNALGSNYVALACPGSYDYEVGTPNCELLIVGTVKNTSVTFTPSVDTTIPDDPYANGPVDFFNSLSAGTTYTTNLNEGQVFQMQAVDEDLSGTVINSTQPIAVFGGSENAVIPSESGYGSFVDEQMPPTNTWGSAFVVVPLERYLSGDMLEIVADVNNTSVYTNGNLLVAGMTNNQVFEFTNSQPCEITSTRPILVAQYAVGAQFFYPSGSSNDRWGAPSMMLVPPVNQFEAAYSIWTPTLLSNVDIVQSPPSQPVVWTNYVNIAIANGGTNSLFLDNTNLSSALFTNISGTSFSFAQLQITPGFHHLSSTTSFAVFNYGVSGWSSYSYPGGMSLGSVASVSSLTLSPQTATNVVFSTILLTAGVTNANNQPLPGVRVDFSVSGSNSFNGFAYSDQNGLAHYFYTGTNFGLDTITASVGASTATATNVWAWPTFTLQGSVSPSGITNINWSQIAGPPIYSMSNSNSLNPTVTVTNPGYYVFQFQAVTNALTNVADVAVSIMQNQSPIVSAGPNQTLTTTSTTLNGSITDDRLPNGTVTTNWSVVSGPGTVTFGNVTQAVTTAAFTVPGVYVLQLTGSDGQATVSSDVTVTVLINPTSISCDTTNNGTLTTSSFRSISFTNSYADYYQFSGYNGEQVTITTTNAAFDTYLAIRNSQYQILAEDDDEVDPVSYTNISTNSEIVYTLPADGTYIIEVASPLTNQTGAYTVSLSCDYTYTNGTPNIIVLSTNGQSFPNGTTVNFGMTLVGSPVDQTFIITNEGTGPLTLGSLTLSGDFSLITAPVSLIAASNSTILTVQCNASTNGTEVGMLTFTNNTPNNSPFTLNLVAYVNAAGTPPVVNIVAPTNNSTFPVGSTIPVSATALTTGSIAQVNFYAISPWGELFLGYQTSPNNGTYNISWPAISSGSYSLFATAVDTAGRLGSSAPVTVQISTTAYSPPVAVNDQFTVPASSTNNVLNPLANDSDPNGAPLTITSLSSLGVTASSINTYNGGTATIINNGQAISYTPPYGIQGGDGFTYYISDGRGGTAKAGINITIYASAQPSVTLTAVAYTTNAGAIDPLIAQVTPSQNIAKVDFYQGQVLIGEVTNGPNGFYTNLWTAIDNTCGCGFTAQATDIFGQVNTSSEIRITVTPPSGVSNSIATLAYYTNSSGTVPFTNYVTIRDGVFNLFGQAYQPQGSNVIWQLGVYTADGTTLLRNLTPATTGTVGSSSSTNLLATCDLSTLVNGVYQLRLSVIGDYIETDTDVPFILESGLKLGQFSFSQQDLIIPVNGIPLTVTRTYNSINPDKGDFGYGWTYSLDSMDVNLGESRENTPDVTGDGSDDLPGGDFSMLTSGGRDVTLTLPNGQRTTFYYYLSPTSDYGVYQPQWQAAPGVSATLGVQGNPVLYQNLVSGQLTWTEADNESEDVPYDNFDFEGFVLTNQDGTLYYIDRPDMGSHSDSSGGDWLTETYGTPYLSQIKERSGDVITINPNSIVHTYTNGATNQIVFQRNADGLISSISDPNGLTSGGMTNGPAAVKYQYDSQDNLISVLNLVNRSTSAYVTNSFAYTNVNFPHYITGIINADGTQVAKNIYDDSGKLTEVDDANGNRTLFGYNTTNNTQTVIDRLGNTNTYVYDTRGNVLAQTNALNQVTTMAYDVNNNKTNEVTFLGSSSYATSSYVYDTTNELLSSTDPLGHTNGFAYDSYGDLLISADARGNSSTNTYDSNTGNLTSTSDALGNKTINNYNNAGLLASSIDPLGNTNVNYYDSSDNLTGSALFNLSGAILSSNTFTYDADDNRLTSTVWRRVSGSWTSATTTNIYDAMNRVTQTIGPNGGTNTVNYDPTGKQQSTVDPLGRTTSYTYDPQGRLIQTTYPDTTMETSAYDANGNRTNSVDRLNRVTTYAYDALNRMTNTVYADNTTNTTVYDGVGRIAQTIDARGTITAFAYDVAGRRLAVTNAVGTAVQNISSYSYDANGNQLTFTDANNHTTTNVFDALNRQVEVDYYDNTKTFTGYDADGRRIDGVDQASITNWFGYDGAGRLISVTNALSKVTSYQYDEAGNEIAQIDALGRANSFVYDGMSRRIAHMMPTNALVERFSYDLAGNMIYDTNFNGVIITNQYDALNRLTDQTSTNGYQVSYTYTPTGQRATMTDTSGLTTYSYDNRDRLLLKEVVWSNGPTVLLNYSYDANGNVTNLWSSTVNGVTNNYQYDALNRLTNVKADGSVAASYTFDNAGNLQAMQYGNGVTNLYQYDSLNRLTNLTWKLTTTTLGSFYYQLGPSGNRTNLNEKVGIGATTRTYAWQYDNLYRLTNENISALGNLGYGYDSVGNRTNRTSSVSGLTGQTPTYNTNDWLTGDSYDNNGNTTNSSGNYYQYDVMNHITNVNSGTILITYDGDGNRVSKKVGGTTTYYLLDDRNPSGYVQVLEEYQGSSLSKVYNYGLNLISQRQVSSGTVSYYGYDGHASTRFLLNTSGGITDTYVYDAFGNLIATSGTTANNYLYAGQQWDNDLGQYYNRARTWLPNTGRFFTSDGEGYGNNEDPLSLHKYLYGADNPVDNDDPSGNDFESLDVGDILSSFDAFPNLVTVKQALVPIEKAQIVVTTEIRPGGPKPGVKTKQGVVVSSHGKLVSNFGFVGVTATKYIVDTGVGSFDQGAGGDNPDDVTVYMGAKAHSAFLPPVLSIRYEFEVDLNFVTHKGHLSGYHRQFPSYNVQVNGKQIYDFQQKHFLGLTGIGEVEPNVDFPF